MKQQRINQLLKLLADGQFHSGEALGEILGVSRAAVHQMVERIKALGLDVFSVSGKGYALSRELELLTKDAISTVTQQTLPEFDVLSVVGSTNDEIKQRVEQKHLSNGYSLFAEAQTAGRGRRGKIWHSPYGSNLYLSLYWQLADGVQGAMGLSIVVGIAVARQLASYGIANVELKWPNDIYIDGRKVAGILVELEGQSSGSAHAIIGMGVNINMTDPDVTAIDQPWAQLADALPREISRNQLAADLLSAIYAALQQYQEQGLAPLLGEWLEWDRYANQPVKLIMGNREVTGIARGIDENGALILEQQGKHTRYFAGELSLRGLN
ncbi:bifunctional biotin--[acetyl-CoA-carboxylase] synthetase/biotin operon repressor [Idiomarina tyrosinivorans]|uniref:Bifunctional ligase/repressor BirA n=1 Tax=Idiomarina tyrosinivorans TaxID=1445662 RepID=A0A432ZJQ5_9GAMM|nr:bifunctional biotin--[acetyl-CoA-carboxylase] ligase/biotin operon repressor BirA [Idiomarina tyrosinivorans]RUO78198.1 bifunctional biotin--[acetyl-CoA-carboxylase] synthetase/biotin operon repressor [Idiomarina tyrosinivorans]